MVFWVRHSGPEFRWLHRRYALLRQQRDGRRGRLRNPGVPQQGRALRRLHLVDTGDGQRLARCSLCFVAVSTTRSRSLKRFPISQAMKSGISRWCYHIDRAALIPPLWKCCSRPPPGGVPFSAHARGYGVNLTRRRFGNSIHAQITQRLNFHAVKVRALQNNRAARSMEHLCDSPCALENYVYNEVLQTAACAGVPGKHTPLLFALFLFIYLICFLFTK